MSDIIGTIPANGELQGVISSAALIAGNVVGMRGLPGEKGDKGDTGNTGPQGADGTDGVSPEITIAEITGGHSITITDADHPSGQTVNVMDGTDGEDGTDGTNGTDGVSPEVTISEITGGHSVTITDADHPTGQTFSVLDGADGQDGTDGTDGQDGYSPTASVSKSGSTATITITDKNGTTTAQVSDGSGYGTITSVKMNGSTIATSGEADLGTVITSHQDISGKVDKVTGKGLSTNDYTTTEKNKLAGIAAGAEVNVQADWSVTDTSSDAYIANKPSIPTQTSDLTNDSGFVGGDVVADEYSTSSTYAVGDYCLYDGDLYRCTTAISIAEAWTAAHWTAVTVADELTDLKGDIPQAVSDLNNDEGYQTASQVATAVSTKQDTLVSGMNIKTVNNMSLLGSGNIDVQAAVSDKSISRDKLALNITDYLPLTYNKTKFEKDGGKTTVWYSIVPAEYKPKLCLANDTINTVETGVDNANRNHSTVSINAGLFYMADSVTKGYLINNGELLNSVNYDDGTNLDYIYMEDDGTLNSIGPSTNVTTAQLQALDPEWAFLGFYTLVKDGVYVATGRTEDVLNPPRTFIGQDASGRYIVGVSSGRNEGEKGLSMLDIYNFCRNNAYFTPQFLYNLDGGGSSNFVFKGTRVNTLTEGEDRKCANFLAFAKDETRILNAFEIADVIGNELIDINKYLYDNVGLMAKVPKKIPAIDVTDCNDVLETGIVLCDWNITNFPINDYGFLITLRNNGPLVNQIALDKSHVYIRELYLGTDPLTPSTWREVYSLPSYEVATSGTNVSANTVRYAKSGNVVIVKVDSYMSATISANSVLATGLPRGLISEQNGVIFKSGNMYRAKVTGNGELMNIDELPSGYYKCSITYFSE